MLKTCTEVSDLVCENCIYGLQYSVALSCNLYSPVEGVGPLYVANTQTCGSGQWFCEFVVFDDDSPLCRTASKSEAISSFMDRDREREPARKSFLTNDEKEGLAACEYLFKRLKIAAKKNYLGVYNDKVMEIKSLHNVGIICNSVKAADTIVEFTIRAEWK